MGYIPDPEHPSQPLAVSAAADPRVISSLVFERDGTLSAEQLENLPAELVERLTSPEFIAQARERIRQQVRIDEGVKRTGRREIRQEPIRMMFSHGGPNRKQRRRLQAALRG